MFDVRVVCVRDPESVRENILDVDEVVHLQLPLLWIRIHKVSGIQTVSYSIFMDMYSLIHGLSDHCFWGGGKAKALMEFPYFPVSIFDFSSF